SLDISIGYSDDLSLAELEVLPGGIFHPSGLIAHDTVEQGLLTRGCVHIAALQGNDAPGEGDVVHSVLEVAHLNGLGSGISAQGGNADSIWNNYPLLGTFLHHHSVA